MVAHEGKEGEPGLGRSLVDIDRHSRPPVADYVAAGHAEGRQARLFGNLCGIGRRLPDELYLLLFIDLHVGPHHELVAGLIDAGADEREVGPLPFRAFGTVELTVEKRSSVPFGGLIARRDGQVDEGCIVVDIDQVVAVGVRTHELVAIGDLDATHRLAALVRDHTAHNERRGRSDRARKQQYGKY